MQERHTNREQYFTELAFTSRTFLIPYIQRYHAVQPGQSVLEIGCGEGGNLLPFAEMGCRVTGVDIARCRIDEANRFFSRHGQTGRFISADIFSLDDLGERFDIVICHDVIEHILEKSLFLSKAVSYLRADGLLFMAFPSWPMPFGGHQQICRSRFCSHAPFLHLLPTFLYKSVLRLFGEDAGCIAELLSIKRTRITIERFEKIVSEVGHLHIHARELYLINPHYYIKFRLRPRRLPAVISKLPFVRNLFCSSCFYILSPTSVKCYVNRLRSDKV